MELFVSEILLSNEIIIYLFTQIILFILLFIAFYFSLSIIKNWDFNKTTTKQYKLEKTSYLVILIITFTLIVKIAIFPYFAYSLDNLSNIVPGAMCAAGIVGANEFGQINLALKILILFLYSDPRVPLATTLMAGYRRCSVRRQRQSRFYGNANSTARGE